MRTKGWDGKAVVDKPRLERRRRRRAPCEILCKSPSRRQAIRLSATLRPQRERPATTREFYETRREGPHADAASAGRTTTIGPNKEPPAPSHQVLGKVFNERTDLGPTCGLRAGQIVTAAKDRSVWYAPPIGWVTASAGLLARASRPHVSDLPGCPVAILDGGYAPTVAGAAAEWPKRSAYRVPSFLPGATRETDTHEAFPRSSREVKTLTHFFHAFSKTAAAGRCF